MGASSGLRLLLLLLHLWLSDWSGGGAAAIPKQAAKTIHRHVTLISVDCVCFMDMVITSCLGVRGAQGIKAGRFGRWLTFMILSKISQRMDLENV